MTHDQQVTLVHVRNRHKEIAENEDNPTISRQISRSYADGINEAFTVLGYHHFLDESVLP